MKPYFKGAKHFVYPVAVSYHCVINTTARCIITTQLLLCETLQVYADQTYGHRINSNYKEKVLIKQVCYLLPNALIV